MMNGRAMLLALLANHEAYTQEVSKPTVEEWGERNGLSWDEAFTLLYMARKIRDMENDDG